MRQPSKGRMQALTAVDQGLVRLFGPEIGWHVAFPPHEYAEMTFEGVPDKALKEVYKDGWIAVPYVPVEPRESVLATLTDKGRAILTHFEKDDSGRWR
ncbi:hypothetical protein [Amycolatopsis sp. cmx-4-54]|uniref:hypothetical protein n=1 Tax=Amycolatopsis sp. cmx-4-54 TaxID=2790936 RepID=UPI003978F2A8